MRTSVAEVFGVKFAISTVSRCRDVVAAGSRAGGLGILGAVAHRPARPEAEPARIDAQTGGSAARLSGSPKGYPPLDVAFAHDVGLIASTLGLAPADPAELAHSDDGVVAAPADTTQHAVRHAVAERADRRRTATYPSGRGERFETPFTATEVADFAVSLLPHGRRAGAD